MFNFERKFYHRGEEIIVKATGDGSFYVIHPDSDKKILVCGVPGLENALREMRSYIDKCVEVYNDLCTAADGLIDKVFPNRAQNLFEVLQQELDNLPDHI